MTCMEDAYLVAELLLRPENVEACITHHVGQKLSHNFSFGSLLLIRLEVHFQEVIPGVYVFLLAIVLHLRPSVLLFLFFVANRVPVDRSIYRTFICAHSTNPQSSTTNLTVLDWLQIWHDHLLDELASITWLSVTSNEDLDACYVSQDSSFEEISEIKF